MMDEENNIEVNTHKMPGWLALSPLIVFLCLYLVTSIIVNDFYKIPITVAFLVASAYAIIITKGQTLERRLSIFSEGASNKNILLMIWIFILAGAFAESAKQMGAIDSTVNLTIDILPGNFLLAGLFLATCFISISIGTSVGTIVALTPVAIGLSQKTGIDLALIVGVVVGGSFFGDNLSFISDTTVAATKTQECDMKDKFRVNSMLVMPIALLIFIIYVVQGFHVGSSISNLPIEWLKIIPYVVVLVTAILGMNVIIVLTLGIILSGICGILSGGFGIFTWLAAMKDGITGMGELIIITLLAGGMLEIIRFNGGIDFVTRSLTKHISGKRGAELSIASLVSIANLCTANNTIAIITTGSIAKGITEKFHLDKRKTASLLDTYSCFIQGIIPYGAQVLMAAGLSKLSPITIVSYSYYPIAVGIIVTIGILVRYPKRYS
jgi:Na+/H+ antiporter NhaC